jgi:hypothetical protein
MAMPDPILHQLASAVEKARAFEQLVGGRHLSRTLNFFIEESAHQIGGWFHGCGGEETDIPSILPNPPLWTPAFGRCATMSCSDAGGQQAMPATSL